MKQSMSMNRRRMLAAGVTAGAFGLLDRLAAIPVAHASTRSDLSDIAAEVERLEARAGIAPAVPVGPADGGPVEPNFTDLQMRLLDLIERSEPRGPADGSDSCPATVTGPADGEELPKPSDVLRSLVRSEAPVRTSYAEQSTTPIRQFAFNAALANEYRQLFDSCVIRPERKSDVAAIVKKIARPRNADTYRAVEAATGVPWYVIGMIHYRECGQDFNSHLHNGDPLNARTVIVPKHRPKVWLPPCDWISSAKDALSGEGRLASRFGGVKTWSVERLLFSLEGYNGPGPRYRGINSGYLWAFSQHYTKGHFYPDHVWNPERVNKQCGTAVLIKAMVAQGIITEPKAWQPA